MVFKRQTVGSWASEIVQVRNAGAWTDTVNDQIWAFSAAAGIWKLIQPDVAGPGPGGDLLPVENLRVQPGTLHDTTVQILWDLPTQPITPNEVWIRRPLTSSVWTIYDYPRTGQFFSGLTPNTDYIVEVRLAKRTGVDTPLQSISRSVAFHTTWTDTPGPPHAGGPGGTTDIPLPPLDNPGPVGGASNCWWQGQLQQWNGTAWVNVGAIVEAVSEGSLHFDESLFTPGGIYRTCIRKKCNPGGTVTAYVCNDPFVLPDDWANPCADHVDPVWYQPPYSEWTQSVFNYTGTVQNWTAPTGVSTAKVTLYGPDGGPAAAFPGGKGRKIVALVPVVAGTNYDVRVGGAGVEFSVNSTPGGGGFNGGGNTWRCPGTSGWGGGGAGASDFRPQGGALATRLAVAGGGGGQGNVVYGATAGNAGGVSAPATDGGIVGVASVGGKGATTAGPGASVGIDSGAGALGVGGSGNGSNCGGGSRGGGGAGWNGGSAGSCGGPDGAHGAGGGGGNSGVATGVVVLEDVVTPRTGHGLIVVEW